MKLVLFYLLVGNLRHAENQYIYLNSRMVLMLQNVSTFGQSA